MSAYIPTFKDGSVVGHFSNNNTYKSYSSSDHRYVNETGDVMQGTLDMNNNTIKNVPQPVTNTDVTNKGFCDQRYLNVSADKMIGTLDMNNQRLINIPNPVNENDASNKKYCDKLINRIKELEEKIKELEEKIKTTEKELEEKIKTTEKDVDNIKTISNVNYTQFGELKTSYQGLFLKFEKLPSLYSIDYDIQRKTLKTKIGSRNPMQVTSKTNAFDSYQIKFIDNAVILKAYFIYSDGYTIDECVEIEKIFGFRQTIEFRKENERDITISYSTTNKVTNLSLKIMLLRIIVLVSK